MSKKMHPSKKISKLLNKDDQYVPYDMVRVQPKKNGNSYAGTWLIQEEKIYLSFMEGHVDQFATQHARRSTKVFERLSEALKNSRTPRQCRSHHQKMQLITSSQKVDKIVEYLSEKIKRRQRRLEQACQKYQCNKRTSQLSLANSKLDQEIQLEDKKQYSVSVRKNLEENHLLIKLNLEEILVWD